MPLPGGAADKLGNRYELWWTVLQVQNLLRGQWDSIRVEVPGDDKVEFELVRDAVRSFHQAKRSAPNGKWTLAELASADAGILQSIADHLSKPEVEYVFVSGSDAHELAELSERSRASASLKEFSEVFTAAKEQQQRLSRLQKYWSNCNLETARDYLGRIEVRVLDEESLKDQATLGAQTLFLAPPANVCSEIRSLLMDSVHQALTREVTVEHLRKAGYVLRQIVSTDRAKLLVGALTKNYLLGTRSRLIQGTLVPREVTNQLIANIWPTGSDCVLTGRAGAGKTGCIAEFVQKLDSDGIPVLAFRLDRVDPVASTADLGRKLGLEESPALVLAAAAENRSVAVLVIDQLDAISTTSGRTTSFFDTVEALLNETRGLRARIAMHIVLVCREFDWRNDHRLRKLLATGHNHVAIGDFTREQVLTVLRTAGYAPESMPDRTLDLLCLPQNLSLFLEASVPSDLPLNTTLDLFEQYWKTKRRLVNERAAPTQDHWLPAIHTLVEGMTENQQLSIRREMLDQIPSDYVEQMVSEGVITLSGNRAGFGHESFFDYCFARQFVISSQPLVDFLLAHEQHLFRRAQVRQVLQYLHEDEPARFCTELEQLVRDAKIRIHLKDLALAVAAATTKISAMEWDLWSRLIESHLNAIRDGKTSEVVSTLALKLEVASKAFAEQREGYGGEIADLLGAIEDPLPQGSIEQLSWLALCSSIPSEEVRKKQSSNGKNHDDEDPHFYGINSTRGRAALAIGTLINHDPQYVERFKHTLQKMTEERSEAVLTCVAFTLRAVAVRDYMYAWDLFQKCCIDTPELRSSKYGVDLAGVGIRAHFDLVRPHIEALLRSRDQKAIELGSQLACIAALMHPEAEEMAEAAVTGDEAQRLAAARVAAANLGVEEFRPWCEKQLVRCFSDTDKKVREEAGNCFRHLDGLPLESFGSLIGAYCDSIAFEDNSHSLLYTLEGSVEKLPGVVCTACEIFLKRFGPEARDFRTGHAADGYTVSKLVFRVYHQHQRDEWGSRTLDVIDRLCQESVGEVMTQLQEFDR